MQSKHISVRHNATSRIVTIEMTEDAVVACYLSGCAFLIGGLIAGCAIFRSNQQKRNNDKCQCNQCKGLYRTRKDIGTGGYGRATLVLRQGKSYVLKRIGCDSINEANAALTEAACLQRLSHPNVVRFEDVFLHRHDNGGCSVSIVMEFLAGGDLIDRLECSRGERPLNELIAVRFLEMLCHALHHVHCCGILHRDLKSSNIFVAAQDRTVKLGDFGLACTGLSPRRLSGSPRRMSRCGTAMYMSPEVAERKPYGATSDTYGLGCVLLEMLLRRQLRERRPFETRRDYINEALGDAKKHAWGGATELGASRGELAALKTLFSATNHASNSNGATADAAATKANQPVLKRVGAPVRRLAGRTERRRRLQYADD